MIYLLVVPLWLFGLLICGALALIKPLRRLSLHLVLMGGFGGLFSLTFSLLLGVVCAVPFGQGGTAGLAFILGFLGGFAVGGTLGALLGHLLAERFAPLGIWRRLRETISRSVPG